MEASLASAVELHLIGQPPTTSKGSCGLPTVALKYLTTLHFQRKYENTQLQEDQSDLLKDRHLCLTSFKGEIYNMA